MKTYFLIVSLSVIFLFMCNPSVFAAEQKDVDIEYGDVEITYEITGGTVNVDDGTLKLGLVQDTGNTRVKNLRSEQQVTFGSLETTDGGIQKLGGLTLGNTSFDQVDVRSTIDIGSSQTSGGRTFIGHNDLRGVKGGSFSSIGSVKVDSVKNNNGTVMMGGYHAGN